MKFKLWPSPEEIKIKTHGKCFSFAKGTLEWHSVQPPPTGAFSFLPDGAELKHIPQKDVYRLLLGTPDLNSCERLDYLGNQGYSLNVTPDGILAEANSNIGLFYALITLSNMTKQNNKIPSLKIIDRPNTEHRAVMIDLARVVESPDFIISLLPFLAKCKLNQIYLYIENKLQLKSHPKLAHPCAWTREEVMRLIEESEKHYIDIIPMIATIGHMESILKHPDYMPLAVSGSGDHLETDNPDARRFIAEVIDEICTLFKSKYVHLAGDECPYLGRNQKETAGKYAAFMTFMNECLHKHGRRGIIWADMVEKYPDLKISLPHELILVVWKYGTLDNIKMPIPEELLKAGFDVAVAPAILADEPFLPTVERLTRNIPYLLRRTGMWGTVNCMWEPRTQNLPVAKLGMAIAGAYSWMPFSVPEKLIENASMFTYGMDISGFYKLLEGYDFFEMMVKSRFGYYHAFELTCNNPMLHMNTPEASQWRKISGKLHRGYNLLKNSNSFKREFPLDWKAFEACATLSIVFADSVRLMQKTSSLIKHGADQSKASVLLKELEDFDSFLLDTLEIQRSVWIQCRRPYDDNFKYWFEDTLAFKSKCIRNIIEELKKCIDSNRPLQLEGKEFFIFEFHKGDAAEWNLLRVKILFSNDGIDWKQMFFRTVPLWMSDGVTLKLMPEGKLPEYMKIIPCYATWHSSEYDWSDMIKIKVGKLMIPNRKKHEYPPFTCINEKYATIDSTKEYIFISGLK